MTAQTHEIFNQPPLLEDYNACDGDIVLKETICREGAGAAMEDLIRFGKRVGSAEVMEWGRQANQWPPVLKSFDRQGRRLDAVEFHPSYHRLMAMSMAQGLHGAPWAYLAADSAPAPGAVVARQAGSYMMIQAESGHCCPITMTNAAVSALLYQPDVLHDWLPGILSRDYDSSFRPAREKRALTLGMGMTEKQGGTDVRANTTRAEPVNGGGSGQPYRLTGHKWFLSAPMCDAFLVLAQAPGGLSCFLMPRFLPDGAVNDIRLMRLKDKVGNHSNASAEVEFDGAEAVLIGEEGRGVRVIIEMATYTRLDCAVASAGLMRQAVAQAIHHCAGRTVFQKHLIDQPMMTAVLADMALECEAVTMLAFRVARAFDDAGHDEAAAGYRRLMTPAAKYWICKRGPALAYEAMETLGGNGYVEEGIMGRLYRELPVNAIWEGSGNVMCLDVLRVLAREPEAAEAVLAELDQARGVDRRYDGALEDLKSILPGFVGAAASGAEGQARILVERLVLLAMAALLLRYSPPAVSDAFCAARLGDRVSWMFGSLPGGVDAQAIVERARPAA